MTHLDLFTGIGGLHLAASWAGFQTVGFSEIEPYCCALLEQHWPSIKNYGDIRTADFSELRGRITVISAGVPCQPASLAAYPFFHTIAEVERRSSSRRSRKPNAAS
jgi:DNA (cytosine-5)-methyltransferase 1